jgi:hypothetical protein
MNEVNNDRCGCRHCPGASCTCGCRDNAAQTACACGPQCACGPECSCDERPAPAHAA